MTSSHPARIPQDEPTAVVVDLGSAAHGTLPVLDLRGPLDTARVEAALDSIAVHCPGAAAWRPVFQSHHPGHHTLRFTADAGARPGDFPLGRLADLLTHPSTGGSFCARRTAATPLQRELLADADAHPGTGRQVGQLAWNWDGPFDEERFTAAWQSVFDCESVLRSAFDGGSEPVVVVHDRVAPEVVRLPQGTAHWNALIERDRRRGLDPRRPGPLRITVMGGGPAMFATAPPIRVVLTHHHALLDNWSVRLLLREFYRAYLAGGRLPGGERRPDMGDYARWLADQDTGPARDFWSGGAPDRPGTAAAAPGSAALTGTDPHATGNGCFRLRLTPDETARLAVWAAAWGATESTVLQAVWALLLYRLGGAESVAPVRFSTTVSGRGILLDGVERLPGALCNPVPLSVVIDPGAPVSALLAELRDRAVDTAGYEWVSAGQIRSWTNDAPAPPDSLLAFETRPPVPDDVTSGLAALGIHVEPPEPLGSHTAFSLVMAAHHDSAGGLALTVSYDRARLLDATEVLAYGALLLRELPDRVREFTTVAEALGLLSGMNSGVRTGLANHRSARAAAAAPPSLGVLRPPDRPGAGTVALLQAPGTPGSFYARLAQAYPGPEELVLLHAVPDGDGARARYSALGPRIGDGGHVTLAGFTGDGAAAYEIARLVAAHGGRPRVVVLPAAATGAAALARTLAATRRAP
ncbi:condensation domain-containing protein [Streptomyces sp. HUAS TT7]|uniref:condensation domain-containing protein n=1 Tax=Streptomyces sp. HUAS TT7 TaxID=3447507 RepID=UPI003F659C1A